MKRRILLSSCGGHSQGSRDFRRRADRRHALVHIRSGPLVKIEIG